jgi:hypothetical protein
MLAMFLLICVVVALCVTIHYEFLYQLTRLMPRMKIRHRLRIVLGVIVAMIAHAVEIWIFALTYYVLGRVGGWGSLEGNFDGSLAACGYFSFTTYTTLGFGDIQPFGELRFLVGIESLTGLVLVTWTASFLYIEMTKYWELR